MDWAALLMDERPQLMAMAARMLQSFQINCMDEDDLFNNLFVKMVTHTKPVEEGCPRSYLYRYAYLDFRKDCIQELRRKDRALGKRGMEENPKRTQSGEHYFIDWNAASPEYLDLLNHLLETSSQPELIQELIDDETNQSEN